MDEFFKASKVSKKAQWSESAFESATYNKTVYLLPVEGFKGFMIANKTLFARYHLKYPTTMTELEEVSKVFVKNGIVPINMGSKGGNPGHLFYNEIVYQMKDGISDAPKIQTSFNVSTDSMLSAANIINQMVTEKMFPLDSIANGDWGPAVALYNERKAAMVYCLPWKIGDIKTDLLPETEVIEFPRMDGAVVDPTTFNVGGVDMGIAVNKASFVDSTRQAAIVEFVDFLVSDEMFSELGKASMMPAKKVKLEPSTLNPLFVKAVDFTDKKVTYQVLGNFLSGASMTAYGDAMDELFAGSPVIDVFAKLQKAVDKDRK
jgi:raffinose/stachyose/melibiose transport system substrate-binding protein